MVDVLEKKEAENKQGSQDMGGSFSVSIKGSLLLRENGGNTQTCVRATEILAPSSPHPMLNPLQGLCVTS